MSRARLPLGKIPDSVVPTAPMSEPAALEVPAAHGKTVRRVAAVVAQGDLAGEDVLAVDAAEYLEELAGTALECSRRVAATCDRVDQLLERRRRRHGTHTVRVSETGWALSTLAVTLSAMRSDDGVVFKVSGKVVGDTRGRTMLDVARCVSFASSNPRFRPGIWVHKDDADAVGAADGVESVQVADLEPCSILVTMDMHTLSNFFVAPPVLAAVLGITGPVELHSVVALVWEYVRTHNLQDTRNRAAVINDDGLREAFGCNTMLVAELAQRIKALLIPIGRAQLQFDFDPAKLEGAIAVTQTWNVVFEDEPPLLAPYTAFSTRLQELEEKHPPSAAARAVRQQMRCVQQRARKRAFMEAFMDAPADFVRAVSDSQTRDLADLGYAGPVDEKRKALFYRHPAAALDMQLYLARWVMHKRSEM